MQLEEIMVLKRASPEWALSFRVVNTLYYERRLPIMKNLIKSLGICVLAGAAYKAGATLWDECLKDKTKTFIGKFKRKKEA